MDEPPQSPDLNIIEAVWDHLERERNKGQPKSKKEVSGKYWRKPGIIYQTITKENFKTVPQNKIQDVQRDVTLNTDFCL